MFTRTLAACLRPLMPLLAIAAPAIAYWLVWGAAEPVVRTLPCIGC